MNKRIAIILGLLFVGLAAWTLVTPTRFIHSLIERLELVGYDIQLRTYVLTKNKHPNSPIAIVDIDDRSMEIEGRWPWPRDKLAILVDQLQKQGAAVIAFDAFFAEAEENIARSVYEKLKEKNLLNPIIAKNLKEDETFFDQDAAFAKSLAASINVLAITFVPTTHMENQLPAPLLTLTPIQNNELSIITGRGYISSIPLLQRAAKGGGFVNVFADGDGIIRRAPLLMRYQNKVYPSLALQAVLLYLDEKVQLITHYYNNHQKIEGIQIGNRSIPTDAKAQVIIPYVGKSYSFHYYSATDVLHNKIKPDALKGKIIFVGTSATGSGDLQTTAIESPFPGVEIQATIANGLLENKFSYVPEWTLGANLVFTMLVGLIAAFFFPYLGARTLSIIILFVPISLLFLNNWIWTKTGLILSFFISIVLIVAIALLNIIFGYLFETRKREQLNEMFGQYVPKAHIDEMLKSNRQFTAGGEDQEMSVLFCDIRNFTTISEGLPANKLVELLNTFFTPMTEIIFKHNGTIDKYVGDLIMAFWGAPLRDKNHARNAIESAIEMQKKSHEMNMYLTKEQWPELKIGIGINSGKMSVGDMGSRYRRNYTVLGDAVNLASRIESLTKFYGVGILVTEYTQKDQSEFVFKKLDKVKVKGKNLNTEIYEVICTKATVTQEIETELQLHHQALTHYFSQEWDAALTLFAQLKQRYPDKIIYKIYMERIQEYQKTPPSPDWDGVYVHLRK